MSKVSRLYIMVFLFPVLLGSSTYACPDELVVNVDFKGSFKSTSYAKTGLGIQLWSRGFSIESAGKMRRFEYDESVKSWIEKFQDGHYLLVQGSLSLDGASIKFERSEPVAFLYETTNNKKNLGLKFYQSFGEDQHSTQLIPFYYSSENYSEVNEDKDPGQIENFFSQEFSEAPLINSVVKTSFKKNVGSRFSCAGSDDTYGDKDK